MTIVRVQYNRLLDRQSDILQATCESRAENRQIELSIILRTVDKDGTPIFTSLENLHDRINERLVSDVMQHMMCVRASVPYEMIDLLPEQQDD